MDSVVPGNPWDDERHHASPQRGGFYRNQSLPHKQANASLLRENVCLGFKREKMVGADLAFMPPIIRNETKIFKNQSKQKLPAIPIDPSRNFISKNMLALKPKPKPFYAEDEKSQLPIAKSFSIQKTWSPSKPIQYNYSQNVQVKLP